MHREKTIIFWHELTEQKQLLYKGLFNWLVVNKEELEKLNEGSVICGEWLGMGVLKYYPDDGFNKRFYMFAKANIDEELSLYNIYYDHELFVYPFEGQQIPDCIGVVPVVDRLDHVPTKEELDEIYDRYMKSVERNVEGFVINYENTIKKYVRMKSGKLQEHFDRG